MTLADLKSDIKSLICKGYNLQAMMKEDEIEILFDKYFKSYQERYLCSNNCKYHKNNTEDGNFGFDCLKCRRFYSDNFEKIGG